MSAAVAEKATSGSGVFVGFGIRVAVDSGAGLEEGVRVNGASIFA